MHDKIEHLGNSIIQHGKLNDRIYLLKHAQEDFPGIEKQLSSLASKNNYSKIVVKIPSWAAPLFQKEGYIIEAVIPGFYNGEEDAFLMSLFRDSKRQKSDAEKLTGLYNVLAGRRNDKSALPALEKEYRIEQLTEDHIDGITDIYGTIFATYPFPIHSPEYIHKTMQENIIYFGVFYGDKLAGVSSAETNPEYRNAEMTDFAVLNDYRGKSLAVHLLSAMEGSMSKQNYKSLYTIARLNSTGMNITFLKNNYKFSGTLINNTNISGKIESMNVYYKLL